VRTVFVDTIAWIALLNRSDGLHTPTQQVMNDLRQQNMQLVTTEFVLIEIADALSAPAVRTYSLRQEGLLTLRPFHSDPDFCSRVTTRPAGGPLCGCDALPRRFPA
jgi:uncharacterized protein